MEKETEITSLKEVVAYLESNPKVEFDPYPQYDDRIYTVLGSLGCDKDYLSKYEEVSKKEIEKMSLNDLKVMYTFMSRGERFCDGCIARFVNDGTLLKLAQRELELLNEASDATEK